MKPLDPDTAERFLAIPISEEPTALLRELGQKQRVLQGSSAIRGSFHRRTEALRSKLNNPCSIQSKRKTSKNREVGVKPYTLDTAHSQRRKPGMVFQVTQRALRSSGRQSWGSSARRRDVRPPGRPFRSNRSSAGDESDSAAPVVSAAAAGTLTLPSGPVRMQPFPKWETPLSFGPRLAGGLVRAGVKEIEKVSNG